MNQLKQELYSKCLKYAKSRVETAEKAISMAEEAAVNDTKSSAGDKYETTREMMQQEISRNQNQLQEAGKVLYALSLIDFSKISKTVQPGSLVLTNNGNFFIAISAGEIKSAAETYFAISPASPLTKNLTGLKAGNKINYNGREYIIKDVY